MTKFYPPKISERFHGAKNAGKAADANAFGTGATFVCGAVLRFTLRIDVETKKILEAKFKTNGCGYAIAAADAFGEKISGRHLTELHSLDKNFLESQIEIGIGEFPVRRSHCLNLATEALQNAFADFRARQIEEFAGEKALICTCFGVSEETIETLVKNNALESVEEVVDACRAGGGCGSCQPLIQEIIDASAYEI